ncbi:Gfo/Idh/MocA family protein [Limobrevibacterium gyesilva]|uniref:Gfo/Idh/MocA family oxidoreductase n=1 Tax=Limobrevibacterium gyesilva TaxID=2991712 RepID=A0AA41YUN3_9PROT|nr:Gfo/Idh/MocA family oxidoreductase [Limobrevibacterium gyesilva]MCW3475737.1 Gfo/Idh/MocA family oxidoreductase [Limobrevibacterium gyesilva]
MQQRFAVIGLDHRHVYDLTEQLTEAGMACAGYWPVTTDPRVLEGFRKRFPHIPEVADKDRLLDDPAIQVIVTAAVPCDRAALAIAAMRRGKDVMADKPGVTTPAQLAEVEKVVAETGRIFSVCFSERFLTPSTEMALKLVRDGAIGPVIQTVGLGPHRLNRAIRPAWFWQRDAAGGILVDIASHQIDQFIVFTDSQRPEVAAASVGSYAVGDGFEDFGEILLRSERATGYLRVDWFTPDGMPAWGDGRLTILGTEGTIELRKYLDLEGRPGTDHLFLADGKGTRHIGCEGLPLSYFRAFAADVANRTETAMPQAHVFTVCRLALEAQARAQRVPMQAAPA